MRIVAGVVLSVAVMVGAVASAQQTQMVDVTTLGPQVGQKAITFQLPDQQGRTQSLATVAGPKGTMLVFFRSSDW
jgi:cytochrome oxidase Cu insertion factor (SCO1/SenC/PrrC family)